MAAFDEYKLTHKRPTDELENDSASSPDTKRVSLYGWDTGTLAKVKVQCDSNGLVKIDPTDLDSRYLKLDQTTPQSVTGVVTHLAVEDPVQDYDVVNYRTLHSAIPAQLQWYLSNSASGDVAGYKLLATVNDAGQTILTVDGTSSGQAIDEWVTLVNTPGAVTISEGEVSVHLYASVARVASTDFLYQIKTQIYKRTGASETQIGDDATTQPVLTTTTTLYSTHTHLTEPLTLAAGDRIVVKLSTVRTGTSPRVTAQVVSFYIGDVTPTHTSLPTTLAILGMYALKDPRIDTVTSHATPTINADTTDIFTITALAENITSMSTNLSGTYVNGQKLIIRILDNGTAYTIAWGAKYKSIAPLPTTTIISKYLYVGLVYCTADSLWHCVSVSEE